MSLVGVEHADPLLYSIGDPLLISVKRGKYLKINFAVVQFEDYSEVDGLC